MSASGNQFTSDSQCTSGNQRAGDDREDAARVIAGDTQAFEGIVRRWQSPLINLAYRFCRDRGRSEEMAQEAFLRAFRNLASWRQESAFSTWLFALATNLFCSELRRIPPISLPFDECPMSQPILAPSTADSNSATRARQFTMPCRAFRRSIARYSRSIIFTRRMFPRPRGVLSCRKARSKRISFVRAICCARS